MSRIREEILQKSHTADGKYWAVSRGGEPRLDLRFSDDARSSLQYHSMQKIEFFKDGAENGEDLIVIDITGVSRFEISGVGLLPIYDGLNRQAARFVAAATSSADQRDQNGVYVSAIREFSADELQQDQSANDTDDDTDAINHYLDCLSEEEAGELVDQAYFEARSAGNALIDEQSPIGERERWNVVAEAVREILNG